MNHLMSGKPGKRRRHLRRKTKVHRSEAKRFRRLLGIG
jgi:ribosomal protein L35